MAGNARQFRSQLMAMAKGVKEDHVKMVTRVAEVAHTTAYSTTPIDTGRAMSGWTGRVNERFEGEPGHTPGSRGSTLGEAVSLNMRNIQETKAAYKFGDSWYIRNNVPYIVALEEGHSRTQAPNGMMSFVIQAIDHEIKR
jgi:3-mercaptopyruvate sulfurtransferase SseA